MTGSGWGGLFEVICDAVSPANTNEDGGAVVRGSRFFISGSPQSSDKRKIKVHAAATSRHHQPPPALSVTSCIRVRSRLPRFWKSVPVTLTTSSTHVLITRQLIWKYWDHILTTAITGTSHDSEILEVRLVGQYLQLEVKTFFFIFVFQPDVSDNPVPGRPRALFATKIAAI